MDPINKFDNFFPAFEGNNDNLVFLITKTAQIISKWFSDAEQLGPLPSEDSFQISTPGEKGCNLDSLFS